MGSVDPSPSETMAVGILGRLRAGRIRRSLEARPRRILVVDDDRSFLESLAALLGSKGWEITCLRSAEEVLLRSDLNQFDLAVIDSVLPGGDGLSLVAELRLSAQGAALPVVLMSPELPVGTLAHGEALGCAGLVTKPIDERIFVETVSALLR